MAVPNTQMDKEKTKKRLANIDLIFEHFQIEWKADFLKILLGKYSILFYTFIVILLWQIFYDVFDGVIVKAYKCTIAYIPINIITYWLFVFIAIGTIVVYYNKIRKIQYRPNLSFSFTVLFVGVAYFPLRWSDKWVFYTLYHLPVALADVYMLFLFGEIYSWVKFLSKTHPEKKNNAKYFGLDDPDDNEDEFNRNSFAAEIAKYICNSFGKRSLAIGISGSWGTGKSYLLHRIQHCLNEQDDRSILVIKFNPWRSSTHNRIVEDFLQTIKMALSVYDKSLSDKLENYLKVLIETDKTNWIKTINDSLSISENKSSEQLYNEINDCLQLIHKKLIIFIDDLDRLHNEEIIEVFRIVRNTADFYNTCFIVAYDREYVQTSFPSNNLQLNNYLDKIFQTEFVLPTIDPSRLKNVIIDEILDHFKDNTTFSQELQQFFSDYQKSELILDLILHRRDAIRFANILSFDLKSIHDDIDYGEFMLVVLLKMKFPAVYNVLHFRDNKNALLETLLVGNKSYYKMHTLGCEALKARNQKMFEELSFSSVEKVNRLLFELFDKETNFSTKSIRYVENFYRYFSLRVGSKDISEEEFWNTISEPFNVAFIKIDNWYKEKSKGSLDIRFLNYNISEFGNIEQIRNYNKIKNYIYGMKKACTNIKLDEAVTKILVALNSGGFNHENFKSLFHTSSPQNIDNQIVDLVLPEGVMDDFNWLLIENLYLKGKDGNKLFTKEKSKHLVIDRFKQLLNTEDFSLLFDSWKTLNSTKDFDRWDNDIVTITNDFAFQVIKKNEKFKSQIKSRVEAEKKLEYSGENKAVLINNSYRKEYNTLKDIAEILSTKFLHLPGGVRDELQNEKAVRISFYRGLIKDLGLPIYHLSYFIDLFGPQMEDYGDYNSYENELLNIYPVKKGEFEKIDNELFTTRSEDFDYLIALRNNANSK